MSYLARLQEISDLSDLMLSAAQSYHWEELYRLENEERELLGKLSSEPGNNHSAAEAAKRAMLKILDNHGAILLIAEPLHQDMKMLLTSFPGLEPTGSNP